jgi:hypothetical protein
MPIHENRAAGQKKCVPWFYWKLASLNGVILAGFDIGTVWFTIDHGLNGPLYIVHYSKIVHTVLPPLRQFIQPLSDHISQLRMS